MIALGKAAADPGQGKAGIWTNCSGKAVRPPQLINLKTARSRVLLKRNDLLVMMAQQLLDYACFLIAAAQPNQLWGMPAQAA